MGIFSEPDIVNSRGDVLSDEQKDYLFGEFDIKEGHRAGGLRGKDPSRASNMLYNWLTGGGPPPKVDPGKIFGDASKLTGVHEKASAGQGINGLFGIGNTIGELASPVEPIESVKPIKMIEPLNQSPMQPGVPYSAIPLPGGK